MKVASLDPGSTGTATLPANSEWQILFTVKDTLGNNQTVYVELDTFTPNTPATPGSELCGRRDACSAGCGTRQRGVHSRRHPAFELPENLGDLRGGWNHPDQAGRFDGPHLRGSRRARNRHCLYLGRSCSRHEDNGCDGQYLVLCRRLAQDSSKRSKTTSGGSYTRIGNAACHSGPPIAALTATPMSGPAPLTVNFDGTGSNEPAGACGTVSSYTLDFGDGTPTETNGTGIFSHPYTVDGDYPARLTVSDTFSRDSTQHRPSCY